MGKLLDLTLSENSQVVSIPDVALFRAYDVDGTNTRVTYMDVDAGGAKEIFVTTTSFDNAIPVSTIIELTEFGGESFHVNAHRISLIEELNNRAVIIMDIGGIVQTVVATITRSAAVDLLNLALSTSSAGPTSSVFFNSDFSQDETWWIRSINPTIANASVTFPANTLQIDYSATGVTLHTNYSMLLRQGVQYTVSGETTTKVNSVFGVNLTNNQPILIDLVMVAARQFSENITPTSDAYLQFTTQGLDNTSTLVIDNINVVPT